MRFPGRLLGVVLTVALGACGGPTPAAPVRAGVPVAVVATTKSYAVGVRHLALRRGAGRPLPTTLWYPVDAPGRLPIVLFSHGLHSKPASYQAILTRWAAAGFVVAAPAYPHTYDGTPHFDRADVANQPADATYVIAQVAALDTRPGDRLYGHLDVDHVAAAGHSAGGHTTIGLFTARHDLRLRAGIVIAGARLGDAGFVGPAAAMLFVHGDADPTVTYARGHAAYDLVPWPKAFLTLVGQNHGRYLSPGQPGFDQLVRTTTDFLRWSLYDDADARRRITPDGTLPGVAALAEHL